MSRGPTGSDPTGSEPTRGAGPRGPGARRSDRPEERGCPLHSDIPGAGPVGLRSLFRGSRVPGAEPEAGRSGSVGLAGAGGAGIDRTGLERTGVERTGVDLAGADRTGAARIPRVWRIRPHGAAREVLRRRGGTTQAGFTAEAIPSGRLRRHPILLSDGPGHDAQRRALGRFFSPQHIERSSAATMEREAVRLVGEAVREGGCDLGQLALLYSVAVSREIVGLTASPLEAMSHRLVRLQRQPGVDLTRPRWGRTLPQWALAAARGLGPLAAFHLRDVRPAIRRRRRHPADDVISHLLDQGARGTDILVECVTYASAGMITTREFLVMACWHLLDDETLRAEFLHGDREEKAAILREIIRLEPVVGHLYRRAREPFDVPGCPATADVRPGDLIDVHVRDANADAQVMGEDPLEIRPRRPLPRGVSPAGLSFGAGPHRCPGEHLAITESAVLLEHLLAAAPRLVRPPEIAWDDVVAGYRVHGMRVEFPARGA